VGGDGERRGRGEAGARTNPFTPFSPDERRRLRKQMEEIYDRFVDRVAGGRGLAREEVVKVARGRVWTGRQALGLGLVDRLGDFSVAGAAAKGVMGVPPAPRGAVGEIRPRRHVSVRGPGLLAGRGEVGTVVTALRAA